MSSVVDHVLSCSGKGSFPVSPEVHFTIISMSQKDKSSHKVWHSYVLLETFCPYY